MRLEIVWDKCWDLLNNISLTYRCLNMPCFFTFFLRLNKYLHGIKWIFSIKKNNENNIEDYITYVISNLSNGYIHLYWTGPSTFAPYSKCMGRCSMESKKDGGNIISSLHIVSTIFVWRLSMCCVCDLLEHISLKKWLISMSASHIPFDNKSW